MNLHLIYKSEPDPAPAAEYNGAIFIYSNLYLK